MIKPWQISAGEWTWAGTLFLPEHPKALILFAHGSGSGKGSRRNIHIANFLHEHGFASFLFDLTSKEELESELFDLTVFAERLVSLTSTIEKEKQFPKLPIVYFGGSTGAAVAIEAAVNSPNPIAEVICRGGRVDLAAHLAPRVTCPVLLIIGEKDREVLEWNQMFFRRLKAKKAFEIIRDAGHLFEEAGQLTEVALVSLAWLLQVLNKNKTTTFSTFIPTNQPNV